jgi:4-amino-4-deoxy-L-arabinose transferase-like glycosyltransferase
VLVLLLAGILRFWQIGDVPPGLYRDEAVNGLDAMDVIEGRREGQSPFYFAANNGREPLYIYLSALFVSGLGQTPEAVRIGAAVVGTLTTLFVYLLAESWFDRRVGILSAILWSLTLWPLHLSRIGLRPILLPLMLSVTFWLATLAYRNQREGKPSTRYWILSGAAYGLSFYTYTAARFTPILLVVIVIYLVLTRNHKPLWPGVLWFSLITLLVMLPFLVLLFQQPELVGGRLEQVSIITSSSSTGTILSRLVRSAVAAMGMFVVKGDTIVRHNLPGRPVFDVFMFIPFLIGTVWSLRNWRRPQAAILMFWIIIMLGPTILAEDAPHFLRAVGVLPAVIVLPALGLAQLWTWSVLPAPWGKILVFGLVLASLTLTIIDYFVNYGRDPETAYWFEEAALSLAEDVNQSSSQGELYLDRRYLDGWPSIQFTLDSPKDIRLFEPLSLESEESIAPAVVYAWPYEELEKVVETFQPPAMVSVTVGDMAKGDLDPEAYPLFVRYSLTELEEWPVLATFDNNIQLRFAELTYTEDGLLQVDLIWSALEPLDQSVTSFVHLIEGETVIAQSDGIPGFGYWPSPWWKPDLFGRDKHFINFKDELNQETLHVRIGLYESETLEPLEVIDSDGIPIGESLELQ